MTPRGWAHEYPPRSVLNISNHKLILTQTPRSAAAHLIRSVRRDCAQEIHRLADSGVCRLLVRHGRRTVPPTLGDRVPDGGTPRLSDTSCARVGHVIWRRRDERQVERGVRECLHERVDEGAAGDRAVEVRCGDKPCAEGGVFADRLCVRQRQSGRDPRKNIQRQSWR